MGKKITDDVWISILSNKSISFTQIAKDLGVSKRTVVRKAAELKLQRPNLKIIYDAAQLKRLYCDELKSIPEISKIIGLSQSTLRLRLIEAQIPIRGFSEALALALPKIVAKNKGKKHTPRPQEWCQKIREAKLKSGKGYSVKKNGYIQITKGKHKHRGYHRMVMEEVLGKKLTFNDVVHHKDGNASNNEITNLEVMSRSDHTRHHRLLDGHKHKRDQYGRYI